jgi:outer membrane protein assembly factor BamB
MTGVLRRLCPRASVTGPHWRVPAIAELLRFCEIGDARHPRTQDSDSITTVKRWIGVLIALACATSRVDAQWPQFRGPDGNGVAAGAKLALTWGEGRNVRWKTPIHGRAWSSPVILDNQLWVTTATEDGHELFAVAVDPETGRILHDVKLFHIDRPQSIHSFNSYASPTPVMEPGRIYVTFGSPGTAAIDTRTAKVIWERRDIECNHYRGAGSSPILFRDLLIMHFDGSDRQFVIALNKKTGKTVWRTDRSVDYADLGPDGKPKAEGDYRKAFATPQIVMAGGAPVLVSLGSKAAYGYDPLTGKELWRVEEPTSFSSSTRPVVGHGLVFYASGFDRGHLIALRPDGRGDVTNTHVVWRVTRGVPNKPSVVLVGDLIFMANDTGIVTCVDVRSGDIVWRSRIDGTYSASPIAAGNRVYFFSEDGKTTVIEAAREFKVLAQNQLEDGFMASPAAAGNALFLRTRTHLYRVEEPGK